MGGDREAVAQALALGLEVAIGRLVGVDAIVAGTVTPMGSSVRVTLKVISVETAEVFGATGTSIPLTEEIRTLLDQAIPEGPTVASGTVASGPGSSPERSKGSPSPGTSDRPTFKRKGLFVRVKDLTVVPDLGP